MIEFLPAAMPHQGCLSCPPKPQTLGMRRKLAVGFGNVSVTCDGKEVWSGDTEYLNVGVIERMAYSYHHGDHPTWDNYRRRSLDYDWRIKFEAPLSKAEYQRQGRRKWVCVSTGMGFA